MKNINLRINFLLFVFLVYSCSTKENIDWKKYEVITNIDELVEFFPSLNLDRSKKYETGEVVDYFDGSKELIYEYELLDSQTYDPLYYAITIETNKGIKEAKKAFSLSKSALVLGSKLGDLEETEVKNIELPGDQNYYSTRTLEGSPNGILYISRRGRNVYSLIISGIYTDDHSIIKDLILPDIASLESFTIKSE